MAATKPEEQGIREKCADFDTGRLGEALSRNGFQRVSIRIVSGDSRSSIPIRLRCKRQYQRHRVRQRYKGGASNR